MFLPRTCAAAALAVAAVIVTPAAAYAHTGTHPFKNCTEAYDNGYANIPEGDKHYGEHLDRDKDGIGCDNPPKDFIPATDSTPTPTPEASSTETVNPAPSAGPVSDNLAKTGGDKTTYAVVTGIGAVVLISGGIVMHTARRRSA